MAPAIAAGRRREKSCPPSDWPSASPLEPRVASSAAPVETRSAGICETRPSPIERSV